MPAAEFIKTAPNVRLHVRDWGAGKPIVFLHGWPLSHEMWEYQFNALTDRGFRCVGISLRGFGRSSAPWSEYSYDVHAQDVQEVLMKLDLRAAIIHALPARWYTVGRTFNDELVEFVG